MGIPEEGLCTPDLQVLSKPKQIPASVGDQLQYFVFHFCPASRQQRLILF